MRYDEFFSRSAESSLPREAGVGVRPDAREVSESTDVHPWARLFARALDVALFLVVASLAWPSWLTSLPVTSTLLLCVIVLLACTVPEAILTAVTGTTPGKWVMGLSVEGPRDEGLEVGAAWTRAIDVWLRGLGAGIPILTPITMLRAYSALNRDGTTSWDARRRTRVAAAGRPPTVRAATGAAAVVALGFIVIAVPGAGNAWNFESIAEANLSNHIATAAMYAEDNGFEMTPISDVTTGSLNQGESTAFSIPASGGRNIAVLGACDADCVDLDLGIVSPRGDTLDTDVESDAVPVVFTRVDESGEHQGVVSMYGCEAEPCYFAAQVFELTGGRASVGTGTCFAIDPEGWLLTARHVVEGAGTIRLTFTDGSRGEARVMAMSDEYDLAALHTDVRPPDFLTLSHRDNPPVGAYVFTLGFPATDLLGHEPKFTDGSVSSLSGLNDDPTLIQTSVPIQPGNSGGPLVDAAGDVVGVMTATATPREFERQTGSLPQNVNWATKSRYVAEFIGIGQSRPPAQTREEAVERAYGATCYLEVETG